MTNEAQPTAPVKPMERVADNVFTLRCPHCGRRTDSPPSMMTFRHADDCPAALAAARDASSKVKP